jgi:hypothetical protein
MMTARGQENDLATLIGRNLTTRRHQNLADVVNLIRTHNLDESFMSCLHPSVHRDFIDCLEEKRRDDEFEERTDRQMEEMMRQDNAATRPPDCEAPRLGE